MNALTTVPRLLAIALCMIVAGAAMAQPSLSPIDTGDKLKKVDIKKPRTGLKRVTTYKDHEHKGIAFKLPSTWDTRSPVDRVTHAGDPIKGPFFFEIERSSKSWNTAKEAVNEAAQVYQMGDKTENSSDRSHYAFNTSLGHAHAIYMGKHNKTGESIWVHFVAFEHDGTWFFVRLWYHEDDRWDMKPIVNSVLGSLKAS